MKKKLKKIIKRKIEKKEKLKKILIFLDEERWDYISLTSENGYMILEIFESFFIVETEKTFKVVKI